MKIEFISFFNSGNVIVTLTNGKTILATSIAEMSKKVVREGVEFVTQNIAGMSPAEWDELFYGPLKYFDSKGGNIFTSNGQGVTFDRDFVTDAEIRVALEHVHEKFGNAVRLTGHDPFFTERMEIIASEMGLTILR